MAITATVGTEHQHYVLVGLLESTKLGSDELSYRVEAALGGWDRIAKGHEYNRHTGEVRRTRAECRQPTKLTTSVDAALGLLHQEHGWRSGELLGAALSHWKASDPRVPLNNKLPLAICIELLRRDGQGTADV